MDTTIEHLVDALKSEYPYVEKDIELLKAGDKLHDEMLKILNKPSMRTQRIIGAAEGVEDKEIEVPNVSVDEIEVLRKKLALLEDSKKLSGIMRDVIDTLVPGDEGFKESGAAVSKMRQRKKDKK